MFLISKLKSKILSRREKKNKEYLLNHGLIIGENVNLDFNGIDSLYPWLIEIGSDIQFAPGVRILAHDASTQIPLGKAKIGRVKIGNYVFIGLNSIVLCNTTIGDNVIIGAGSIVTSDIPSNSVYAGNPAKFICTFDEYIEKNKKLIDNRPNFESPFWIWPEKDKNQWDDMKEKLQDGVGYL